MTDRIGKLREKAERTYLRGNSAKTDAQQFAYETAVRWAGIALTYTDEDVERAAEALWRNKGRSPEHHEWSDVPRWLQAAHRESAMAALESFGARRAE